MDTYFEASFEKDLKKLKDRAKNNAQWILCIQSMMFRFGSLVSRHGKIETRHSAKTRRC